MILEVPKLSLPKLSLVLDSSHTLRLGSSLS